MIATPEQFDQQLTYAIQVTESIWEETRDGEVGSVLKQLQYMQQAIREAPDPEKAATLTIGRIMVQYNPPPKPIAEWVQICLELYGYFRKWSG